jgi:Fic family protein
MPYNWQQPDWPNFIYDTSQVEDLLIAFAQKLGRSTGLLDALSANARQEAIIELMIVEATKTSAIENEHLSRKDIMSSIQKNLGLTTGIDKPRDQRAVGISELMISIRKNHDQPLSEEMLYNWHKMIMKGGRRITTGRWRSHEYPMQVVSGVIGPRGDAKIYKMV